MSDTISTPCQRLMEADQAYHDLIRGAKVRSVQDENGESVSYTQASTASLLAYITKLAPLCTTYVPVSLGQTGVQRPLRFFFF